MKAQRWTVDGHPQVEAAMQEAADRIARIIEGAVPPSRLRVASVIGGYGRGEGGVLLDDAGARPHNNLDVLIVTRGWRPIEPRRRTALQRAIAAQPTPLPVPVDLGWVTDDLEIADATVAADVDDWDSLNHVKLVVAIEEQFGVRFANREIAAWEKVGDMREALAAKLSA